MVRKINANQQDGTEQHARFMVAFHKYEAIKTDSLERVKHLNHGKCDIGEIINNCFRKLSLRLADIIEHENQQRGDHDPVLPAGEVSLETFQAIQ